MDIRGLLKHYAELEEISIPTDCDGLVIGLNQPEVSRPHVVINSDKPPRRRRFSMAHELGHILIPGHVGIEVCYMAEGYSDSSSYDEAEAHAFASEALMPTRWLEEIVAASSNAGEIFETAEVAEVSAAAAMLAINRVLPPGHIVTLMASGHVVEMALSSPGTQAHQPPEGEFLDRESIDPLAAAHGAVMFSRRQIYWWVFDPENELTADDDERTASEVLREIVEQVFPDDRGRQQHALSSINGVASHAKVGFEQAKTPEEMLARLHGRLAGRSKHVPVMRHPLFETFLAKKAREMTGGIGES